MHVSTARSFSRLTLHVVVVMDGELPLALLRSGTHVGGWLVCPQQTKSTAVRSFSTVHAYVYVSPDYNSSVASVHDIRLEGKAMCRRGGHGMDA